MTVKNLYIVLGDIHRNLASGVKNHLFTNYTDINYKIIITKHIVVDSNSIYFFMKSLSNNLNDTISLLREGNNKIIYQVLDRNWKNDIKKNTHFLKELVDRKLIDHLIFNSNCHMNLYELKIKKSYIFHEYDNRYEQTKNIKYDIEYHGHFKKSSFNDEICKKYNIKTSFNDEKCTEHTIKTIKDKKVKTTKVKGIQLRNSDACIHIDYLKNDKPYYYYHTSTKLSTALLFNCVFICNRIPVYVEILGGDYKYYIEDDLSNLQVIIDKSVNVLKNKTLYDEYINEMKQYKDILSPPNIFKNYIDIFNNV
jgi:hypothetical protein